MIPGPYLLYLGDTREPMDIKTSRGIAAWRPDLSRGEYARPGSPLTLDLPRLGFAEAKAAGVATLVIGIANPGGLLGPAIVEDVLAAIAAGLNIASGLHQRLRAIPEVAQAAAAAGVALFDVRDPPADLTVGKGLRRAGRRLLTVGTDCSVGKMYASLALVQGLRERGLAADFRATGQTGIFIAESGIPIDAVVADFISGAAERLSPARDDGGWDVIEGQGALSHPSFAGVSLGLLHGAQPTAIVVCHEAGRPHMRGLPHYPLAPLAECIATNLAAARLTSPDVVAAGVALNTSRLSPQEAEALCAATAEELGLPCQDPVRMGVGRIVDRVLACAP